MHVVVDLCDKRILEQPHVQSTSTAKKRPVGHVLPELRDGRPSLVLRPQGVSRLTTCHVSNREQNMSRKKAPCEDSRRPERQSDRRRGAPPLHHGILLQDANTGPCLEQEWSNFHKLASRSEECAVSYRPVWQFGPVRNHGRWFEKFDRDDIPLFGTDRVARLGCKTTRDGPTSRPK